MSQVGPVLNAVQNVNFTLVKATNPQRERGREGERERERERERE